MGLSSYDLINYLCQKKKNKNCKSNFRDPKMSSSNAFQNETQTQKRKALNWKPRARTELLFDFLLIISSS